jgi:hypothetical protein
VVDVKVGVKGDFELQSHESRSQLFCIEFAIKTPQIDSFPMNNSHHQQLLPQLQKNLENLTRFSISCLIDFHWEIIEQQ